MSKKPVTYRSSPGHEFEIQVTTKLKPEQYIYVEVGGPMNLFDPDEFVFPSGGMVEREGLLLVRIPVPEYVRPGSYAITRFEIREAQNTVHAYPPDTFGHIYVEILDEPPAVPDFDLPEVTIGE